MGIQRVGHVVLKVRDLEKAKWFYVDLMGMHIGKYVPDAGMFLRFKEQNDENAQHHDLAIFKTGDDADPPKENQVGLFHVALQCENENQVREYYDRFKAAGIETFEQWDHKITHSIYIRDPDGNAIEIYCDVEDYNWREEGMGFMNLPYDIEDVPPKASTS